MNIEKFDPRKNLFIEASAGTGKTYTIQQIVAKLVGEGCPLKKILIVTYTEKAAGELRDRIRKKMEEVLDKEGIDRSVAENFERALRSIDNAAIFTIHSFCQKALKEFAYEAGRPFDLAMVDDKSVKTMISAWARDKWPKDELYQTILQAAPAADSLEKSLTEKLSAAIDMYKGESDDGKETVAIDRAETSMFETAPKNFADLLGNKQIADNIAILEQHRNLGFTKTGAATVGDFVDALKEWQDGAALFNGKIFKSSKTLESWPREAYDAFLFFKEFKDDLKEISSDIFQKQVQKFLYSQIKPLFVEWQKYKNDNKMQSFNDMILSVHSAVLKRGENGEASELCKRLREQYRYAIIDEFQDTNQLQWDIFKEIFLDAKDHSIFVVGDPKQSIYSFQGADVNVYLKATKEIGNGDDLKSNFRSTNSVIEACNKLFACKDFFGEGMAFKPSYAPGEDPDGDPENKKLQKPNARFYNEESNEWEEAAPFWISESGIGANNFAQTCVEKIIDCCTYIKDGKKTKLQIFNKDSKGSDDIYRNVTFRDFAILARSRNEMENIDTCMKLAGVPYTRYKDSNLFYGRECAEWISLFKAINATDFSAWNRRILNEALITDFFAIDLADVESETFDDPFSKERKMICHWKELANQRRFAEMQESIYGESEVEKRLSDLSKLQEFTKLRQIGNYAINYLYNHSCTLDDLIRHLQDLASLTGDADDQDGNLVAKGTDFDAVQVMTIHASKGLEFPVVISVAGFKQLNRSTSGPYLYHEGDSIRLGYGAAAKEARQAEELQEWERLFYVDFTRASSILVLPRYSNWFDNNGNPKEDFRFLSASLKRFCSDEENAKLFTVMPTVKEWDYFIERDLKRDVQEKILAPAKEASGKKHEEGDDAESKQNGEIQKLQKSVSKLGIMQHSYSTLAGKKESTLSIDEEANLDKEGSAEANHFAGEDIELDATQIEANIRYPRGSKIGNALHEIFELSKFKNIGLNHECVESMYDSAELAMVVEETFKKQSLPIWDHKEEWTRHTLDILWNTLNASLPAIEAGHRSGESFALKSLDENSRKAEVQFNLNATTDNNGEASEYLQSICKGFIDLVFMRRDTQGQLRFSIVDWKSDVMADGDYSPASVQKKVDEDYSVQRVLYCYCLIKWLKQFYGAGNGNVPLSESEIFDKYFGGMYYIFVRGCKAGTENGIYAHTWENFAALEKSYSNIRKLMRQRKDAGEDEQ